MREIFIPAVVPADREANTSDILVNRVAESPDRALFAIPRADGGWDDVSSAEFEKQVKSLAKGLIAAGIEPGEHIGFMARTTYEWTLVDFAIWYAGCIMVPIYETSAAEQIRWNLVDSDAVAAIFESEEFRKRFDEVSAEIPAVTKVWQLDDGAIAALSEQGAQVTDEELERRRSLAKGSDIATLIYTAGTTGKPKGCIITHSNFVELSRNAAVAMKDVANDEASTVLFITLAHIFARYISVLGVCTGTKVGHQPDTSHLVESLGSFKPTFFLAVPRVFEKVYNSAEQKAEGDGKGKIFRAAATVAVEHSKALDAGKVPLWLGIKFSVFDTLVYKKLRAVLGGRAKYAISGSAPLGEFLGHFFRSVGLRIMEGYGLTETTAPATVGLPHKFRIGTVGPALPGTGIRIAEDGEILVKGVNVFGGYWKNEEATAEVFEDDWFRTGDIGTLDDDGFLTITGRKKEIIVTAGGKNVAPAALEDPIRANPLISQVVAVGDKRPFISALITLDPDMLPVWLNNNGEDAAMSAEEAATNPTVLAGIQRTVDQANAQVSRAESIRKFVVLPHDFTQESGHLTPKLSVRRHVILADLADTIDEIYSAAPPTQGMTTVG